MSIKYRWALGQYDRLPELVAELVHRPVTVLATFLLAAECARRNPIKIVQVGDEP